MLDSATFHAIAPEYRFFRDKVLTVCLLHNGSETSGFRTVSRNAIKRGHPESLHLIALAVDVTFDTPNDQQQALELARTLNLHFDVQPDHVHFQARPVQPRTNAP